MSFKIEQLKHNLESVQDRIGRAASRAGRDPATVRLVAVTKKSSPESIRPLVELGACDLGENYPQELWRKHEVLVDLAGSIRWHLIGHLQSNKVKKTLPMVAMIHSVDSLRLLRVLDEQMSTLPAPPAVCLQVNTSAEASKHGWSPDELMADAEAIGDCRLVPVVGLMTMAAWGTTAEEARPSFVTLRELRDRLHSLTGLPLPELSMGMSGDFEAAILEGATLVRVGSAIFEGAET
jgi:PLP dependent protein